MLFSVLRSDTTISPQRLPVLVVGVTRVHDRKPQINFEKYGVDERIPWKIAHATSDKTLRQQIARAVSWDVFAHIKQVELWFTLPNVTDSLHCDRPEQMHC